MGDAEYLAAFQQIILPIAYQFNPQLVLVAAGFDAAQGDPLGGSSYNSKIIMKLRAQINNLFFFLIVFKLKDARSLQKVMDKWLTCCLPSPKDV